jgi:hypothetical protein
MMYKTMTREERLMPIVKALEDRFFTIGGQNGLMSRAEAAEIALALESARVTISPPATLPGIYESSPGGITRVG